ncbi:hypothetical protein ABGB14_36480 [Nonomuraea sp. B10E15]|uniref:hypothetical protein n=1 Tax=Nonomuraea sp. B10E15 TaxID=3153560 RepID=UPI00325F03D7
MDLWKTLQVMVRRWYVTVPMFLAALGVTGAIFITYPTYYDSEGLLILTVPTGGSQVASNPAENAYANPLLAFDEGLRITSTFLIQAMNTPEVADTLVDPDSDDSLSVTSGELEGPFIAVKATSTSPERARRMVTDAIVRTRLDLLKHQRRLAPSIPATYIVMTPIIEPTTPIGQNNLKLRAAGAALGVGLAASLLAVYGTESYLNQRRRRQEARAVPEQEAPPEPEPQPDEQAEQVKQYNGAVPAIPSKELTGPADDDTLTDIPRVTD